MAFLVDNFSVLGPGYEVTSEPVTFTRSARSVGRAVSLDLVSPIELDNPKQQEGTPCHHQ